MMITKNHKGFTGKRAIRFHMIHKIMKIIWVWRVDSPLLCWLSGRGRGCQSLADCSVCVLLCTAPRRARPPCLVLYSLLAGERGALHTRLECHSVVEGGTGPVGRVGPWLQGELGPHGCPAWRDRRNTAPDQKVKYLINVLLNRIIHSNPLLNLIYLHLMSITTTLFSWMAKALHPNKVGWILIRGCIVPQLISFENKTTVLPIIESLWL